MKRIVPRLPGDVRWGVVALLVLAVASCDRSDVDFGPQGRLQALVRNEFQQGVAGKTIEILEVAVTRTTDDNGVAEFTVAPGPYVVRAYDLGGPGPARSYVDQNALVRAGKTVVIEFLDCQTCDAPGSFHQASQR